MVESKFSICFSLIIEVVFVIFLFFKCSPFYMTFLSQSLSLFQSIYDPLVPRPYFRFSCIAPVHRPLVLVPVPVCNPLVVVPVPAYDLRVLFPISVLVSVSVHVYYPIFFFVCIQGPVLAPVSQKDYLLPFDHKIF